MSECRVKISNISVSYRNECILSDISLELNSGKIYGLFAKNGIGKITLLKVLSGIFEVDKGKVIYQENTHISYSIDDSLIIDGLKVEDNIVYYRKLNGVSDVDEDFLTEIIELTGVDDFKTKRAGRLSKGMRQRVSLAISMITKPNLLILDEAISGIDVVSRKKINSYFRAWVEKEKCVVVADHDVSNLLTLCDEIIFLKNNSEVTVFTMDELLGGNTDVSTEEAERILIDILES